MCRCGGPRYSPTYRRNIGRIGGSTPSVGQTSSGGSSGGSVSLPNIPGSDFAAGVVNGVTGMAAGVVGNLDLLYQRRHHPHQSDPRSQQIWQRRVPGRAAAAVVDAPVPVLAPVVPAPVLAAAAKLTQPYRSWRKIRQEPLNPYETIKHFYW